MPNGRHHLQYSDFGNHSYSKDGTSDCGFNCGCWLGPTRSGGLAGIDPFGKCPENISTKLSFQLTKAQRRNDLINARIRHLEIQVFDLKRYKELVDEANKSTKINLQKQIKNLNQANSSLKRKFNIIKNVLEKTLNEILNEA